MGRKPNAIIIEYFERGEKLDDMSNRYKHTCKSCGEQFPKGRFDTLNLHLLQKCPAIPFDERQRIIQRMSETTNQRGLPNQLAVAMKTYGNEVPPQLAKAKVSALETLAEVSRQRLGADTGSYTPSASNVKKRKRTQETEDATLAAPEAYTSNNVFAMEGMEQRSELDNLQEGTEETTHDRLWKSMQAFAAEQEAVSTSEAQEPETSQAQNVAPVAHMGNTQNIAIAASDLIPNDAKISMPNEGNLDLGRQSNGESTIQTTQRLLNAIDPQLRSNINALLAGDIPSMPAEVPEKPLRKVRPRIRPDPMQIESASVSLAQASDLPHSRYLNNFSIGPNAARPRVRGRFAEGRRKEVQEIRRQGACLRCRMLKKPCSAGIPCNTCKSVDTARLWKQPCVKAKLVDEFDVFSAGVHVVAAFQKVNDLKSQQMLHSTQRVVRADHLGSPDGIFAKFAVVSVAATSSPTGSNQNGLENSPEHLSNQINSPEQAEILNVDYIGGHQKLDQYFRKIGHDLFVKEPSVFMQKTLLLAESLVHQRHDNLLGPALDLWIATAILVDPELPWHLAYYEEAPQNTPDNASSQADVVDPQIKQEGSVLALGKPERDSALKDTSDPTGSSTQPLRPAASSSPRSKNVQILQLLAQTEKIASAHTKVVIAELERRLINRHQAVGQQFESLLASVILLNCVERMCWLLSNWPHTIEENNERVSAARARADYSEQAIPEGYRAAGRDEDMNHMLVIDRGAWPLPTHPSGILGRAEKVAEVITMLVRFRGIECLGKFDEHGILCVLEEDYQPARMQLDSDALDDIASSTTEQAKRSQEATWLDSVQLSKQQLEEARLSGLGDVIGSVNGGDLDSEHRPRMTTPGSNDDKSSYCRSWDLKYIAELLWPEGEQSSRGFRRQIAKQQVIDSETPQGQLDYNVEPAEGDSMQMDEGDSLLSTA